MTLQAARIVFGLCVAIMLTALPLFRAEAVVNDNAMAEGEVFNFYEKYLKALHDKTDFDLRQQREVHPAFAQKIEDLITEAESREPGFLGYDPILMAQDIPESMEYGSPSVFADSAAMLVYTVWGDGRKNALCISLLKEQREWRIIDINSLEEKEADCHITTGRKN